MLGFFGGLAGVGVGFLLSRLVTLFKIGGMIDHVIVSSNPKIFFSGFLMALGASTLSSFLPARAASRLRPIDIVRSGE